MAEPTKPNVPSISADEQVQAANAVAAHAKSRFLMGFADEAESLMRRAAAIIAQVDKTAVAAFEALADKFAAHAPAPAAGPDKSTTT